MPNHLFQETTAVVCMLMAGLTGPAYAQEPSASSETTARREVPAEQEAQVRQAAEQSFHGPDSVGKDGPMAKVAPKLIELYHRYRRYKSRKKVGTATGPFEPSQPRMPVTGGRHLEGARAGEPYVTIDAVASGDPSALRDSLEALGLRRSARADRVVSGFLPVGALRQAVGLSLMNSAAPSILSSDETSGPPTASDGNASTGLEDHPAQRQVRRKIGQATTQGDASLRADQVRRRFGVDGSGVKVCAVSYGFSTGYGSTTAGEDVQNGDLPGPGNPNGYTQPVDVVNESPGESNDEGRAMLQIIHDIAPGAALGFSTVGGGLATFADNIRELADAGCDVIADDVNNAAQPMFQDGIVSKAVDQVARNQGVVYFNQAGNEGARSYARPFSGSSQPASSVGISGAGELHDFDPTGNVDTRQQITLPAGAALDLRFQWDDPFFRISGAPGADTDLDIYLLDGETVVASSTRDNVGGDPFERLFYDNSGNQTRELDLAIVLADGPEPRLLKYIDESGDASIDEYRTGSSTVFAHNDAATTVSVGASSWFNTSRVPEGSPADPSDPPILNGISSKGGTPLLFDKDGNRLSEPVRRRKPDITAPTGGNTSFFGTDVPNSLDRDDLPNFFGTSAASPHAAAVAALMLQASPGLSPSQIEKRLEESATDIQDRVPVYRNPFIDERTAIPDGEGEDRFSGAGLIRANKAVRSVLSVVVTGLDAEVVGEGATPTVSIRWQTSTERNSEAFVIERRPGPLTPEARRSDEDWIQFGVVPSRAPGGTSSDTLQYEFSRQLPRRGRYAFRLRQRTEGGPEAGRLIGAATEAVVPIRNFSVRGPRPNPSQGTPQVEVVVEETQQVQVLLYDALGRQVRTLIDERLEGQTPRLVHPRGQELASGTYFLQIKGSDFVETRKLVIVK